MAVAVAACGGEEFGATAGPGPDGGVGAGGSGAASGGRAGAGGGGGAEAGGASPGGAGGTGTSGGAGTGGTGTGGGAGAGGTGTGGAGTGGAGAGGAGTGGAGGEADAGSPPAVVYVSESTGRDIEFDGLSPATPKRTIAAGITAAERNGLSTVRICNGQYAPLTPLVVPLGLSLLGGFDCATFSVQSDHGSDALCSDQVDEEALTTINATALTAIRVEGGDPQGTTLLQQLDVIASTTAIAVVQASPVIEHSRLRIRETSRQEETAALRLTGGAAEVRDSCIRGGGGTAIQATNQIASTGVLIEAQSTATLTRNIIDGGVGAGAALGYGSSGVYITGAAPIVSGNDIRGGAGTSSMPVRTGSIGLYAYSSFAGQALAPLVEKNVIDGGSGAHTASGGGSAGVILSAAQNTLFRPTVLENTIGGGRGTNLPGSAFSNVGVSVYQVSLDVIGNTITGGTYAGGPTVGGAVAVSLVSATGRVQRNSLLAGNGNYRQVIGLSLSGSPSTLVDNNMIHGGLQTAGTAELSAGLLVSQSATVAVRHNTLVLAPRAAQSFAIAHAAGNDPGRTATLRLENNLIVGGDHAGHGAFRFDACPDTVVSSFAGNALANLDGKAVIAALPTSFAACPALGPANLETFQPLLAALCTGKACAGNVAGNLHLRDTCQAPGTCAPLPLCFTQEDCAIALFQAWSAADTGASTLVGPEGGWRLREGLRCDAQQSPFSAQVSADRFSATRSAPFSRGAHEQEECAPGG